MLVTGQTLFAFVDLKDPFVASMVADEEQPGPILSLMSARKFDFLFLFYTPHTRSNAVATQEQVRLRHLECHVMAHELPVSDPKDYSSLMGRLGREVRSIMRLSRDTQNHVCVSSGTAEMRAAWFLLTAVGVLPATLLQVGSPAEPLFGPANVREVRFDIADWESLRDLVMPRSYGSPGRIDYADLEGASPPEARLAFSHSLMQRAAYPAEPAAPAFPELEEALQELGIFIGSASLRSAAESAAVAAATDLPVLLCGETGTGKELFARLLHRMSPRQSRDMVAINCAAIPKDLVESHLFGHLKGAFTGAINTHKGKFEVADGSTLFLDEIAELPVETQAKLLRIVQDGKVEQVGSHAPRKVDVRIVAATNRDLREEIKAGRFREDLFFRLEVVRIQLPPLRERREEIPELATSMLKKINQRRRDPRRLSKEALQRLEQHHWPGNVRELSNVMERSVLYARTEVLGPDDLIIEQRASSADPLAALPEPGPNFSLDEFQSQVRKQLILRALAKCNGNQSAAAGMLGITKQAVSKFLKGETDNPG